MTRQSNDKLLFGSRLFTAAVVATVTLASALILSAQESATVGSMERHYARLTQDLISGKHFEQKAAAEALSKIAPREVQNADLRKQIARGFKDLAFDDLNHPSPEAIRGLWVWGGKYSIPLLIELFEAQKHSGPRELYEVLAESKNPQAARALASKLGDFFCGEEVAAALKKMGPVAEDVLIEVAPSSDADVALAAVALLGDCGTEKSSKLLRQAMRSRNRKVKEVAKNSWARIRARLAAGQTEVASSEDSESPFAASGGPSAAATILSTGKPPTDEGDWSEVKLVMAAAPAGDGVPSDPAPAAAWDLALKPIALSTRADGFRDRPVAFSMAAAERPLAVVVHSQADGAISQLEVVDLRRGKAVATSPGPGGMLHVSLAPGCARAVTLSGEGSMGDKKYRITLWTVSVDGLQEVSSWMPYGSTDDHWESEIKTVEWLDSERFWTVNGTGQLVCWMAEGAKAIYQMQLGRGNSLPQISPGGRYFAVPDSEHIAIYSTHDGSTLAHLEFDGHWGNLAFDRAGRRLACQNNQTLWIWNLETGELEKEIYCLNMSPYGGLSWLDDTHVLAGGTDAVDLECHVVAWRYNSRRATQRPFQDKIWYLLKSGNRHGLVPYKLPHEAAVAATKELTPESLFVVRPGDAVGLDVRLSGSMRQEATKVLTSAIEASPLAYLETGSHRFVAQTSTESEQAHYRRFGESLFSDGTSVNVQKKVYEVRLDVDGKLAWQYRSTQSAPMHLRLQEGESIQQGVNRSTQASAGYFNRCRIPSHIVHPDQAGPHGTSQITTRGLQ